MQRLPLMALGLPLGGPGIPASPDVSAFPVPNAVVAKPRLASIEVHDCRQADERDGALVRPCSRVSQSAGLMAITERLSMASEPS
jgi:hypothetical protein